MRNKKNLLAFSAGTDSSALFHMLEENNIQFDMIMVNYNTREESKKEVEFAKNKNKHLHLLETNLDLEKGSNFEKVARDIRYEFFDKEMINYDNLILGHNLSDKVEWFLMQFIKGAGVKELYGMETESERKDYTILRPILDLSKEEILKYLKKNNIEYFYDKSNDNKKFTRNFIRHNFSEKLLKEGKKGILKTFKILEKEKKHLPKEKLIEKNKEYCKYEIKFEFAAGVISRYLKERGYLLSGGQRNEFEEKEEITVKSKDKGYYSATYREGYLYISPYDNSVMPKKIKEEMREKKIPPKHRRYLSKVQSKNMI